MKILRTLVFAAALVAVCSCASSPAKSADAGPAAPDAAASAAVAPASPAAASASIQGVDLALFAGAKEECRVVLEKSAALASEGKWKSAVAVLDDYDKDAADPYILALKTRLLLAGAVASDALLAFAVVDLDPGQDIEKLRAAAEEYELFDFDPAALADAQAAKGVKIPPILSITLGDYYYDVLVNCQDSWDISPYEIASLGAARYRDAFEGGLFMLDSLKKQSELYSGLEMYEQVEPVYKKIIELDPDDPSVHYGYAISLQKRDKIPEMLDELDLAIEAYGDSQDKAGIIALAAITASDEGDAARSEAYLADSDKSFAGTSLAGLLRHYVAVNVGDFELAASTAGKLIDEYGADLNVARDVVVIWYQAGDPEGLRAFMERRIAAGGESLTVANLEFLLAVLIMQDDMSEEDRSAANAALDDAEKRMAAELPPDDDVFTSIKSVRESLAPPASDEDAAEAE
jgi:tetratricopeptide (TPR) repeat protein